MGIVLAILVFGLIIFVHEMGHFLLAKANKIRVDEFSLGMGPRIFSFTKGETRYSLKLLPLGGSCMMGEDDADDMSEGSFNSKSVWARISVVVAGAIFNFILALVFAIITVGITGYITPKISAVDKEYPAAEAGLEAGDIVKEMNGKNIHIWQEISLHNQLHAGEKVEVVYERDGKEYEATIKPKKNADGVYLLGISSSGVQKANVFTAVQYGAYEVKYCIGATIESLKMLLTGKVGVNQLSGPVGIVDEVDKSYKQTKEYGALAVFVQMLSIGTLISANLGVMNLLPIPALDGGRLVFLFVEAIIRKRIPPNKEGWIHGIGMVLLLALMAFVMFNDIKRVFF